MSHVATQIRSWFISACTGVSGLPTATEGSPRQIEAGQTACFVRNSLEQIDRTTEHEPPIDSRILTLEVVVLAETFSAADVLSVLAEEAIANASSFPGSAFEIVQREYDETRDTDRDYVSVTITYAAAYSVYRNDVETAL